MVRICRFELMHFQPLDLSHRCTIGAPHKPADGKAAVVTAIKNGNLESVECLLGNISCDASIMLEV